MVDGDGPAAGMATSAEVVAPHTVDLVMEWIGDGAILFTADGRVLKANKAAQDLLCTHAVVPDPLASLVKEFCRAAPPLGRKSHWLTIGNGNIKRHLFIHLIPLHDLPGAFGAGVAALIFDETETEDSRRQRESFFSLALHEIRNPLTVVKSYLDFFGAELSRTENERLKRALLTVRRNVDRITELIQDLLDHTRLELGVFSYDLAPVWTEAIVEAIIPEAQLLCAAREQELETVIEGKGQGHWDRLRIEQVLLNLITNAVKFSPPRGAIRFAARVKDGQWHVTVTDEGVGLTADELEGVFQPFYRSANALARGLPGTGLGLSICRQLVQAHGGAIWAESPGPGKGCSLSLVLSLMPEEKETKAPHAAALPS